MKPCRTDIEICLALQQDVRTHASNLIYGVRLQENVGDRPTKNCFCALLHCSEKIKINLRKWAFCRMDTSFKGCLSFNFSMASIKSSCSDIFSFPNKLKCDDSNICTKILIREQKIVNNCPSDMLISLKSHVWMLKYFALLKYDRKFFKHNVKTFSNSPWLP